MSARDSVLQAIDAAAGDLVELARRIHAHPEVAARGFAAMLTAAKVMALTALDVLTNPVFLEEIRADFGRPVS